MSKGDVKAERKSSNPGTQSQRSSGGSGGGGGGAGRSIQLKRDASRAGEFQAQEAVLAPVQRKGQGSASGDVHSAAAHGTSGSAAALPHAAQIQRAFGDHDISHIKAHTDQKAAEGSAAMGAEAYASGDRVAFKGAPSLHTAAHEAAHIVQQQAGVQLSGGVGQAGDSYEKQADAVADAVVAGKDASGLLGKPKGGGTRAVQRAIQRKDEKPAGGIKREGVTYSNLILPEGVKKEDLDARYKADRPKYKSKQATLEAIAALYQNRLPADWDPPLHDLDKAPASAPSANLRMPGPGGAPFEPGSVKPEKPNIADHLSPTERPPGGTGVAGKPVSVTTDVDSGGAKADGEAKRERELFPEKIAKGLTWQIYPPPPSPDGIGVYATVKPSARYGASVKAGQSGRAGSGSVLKLKVETALNVGTNQERTIFGKKFKVVAQVSGFANVEGSLQASGGFDKQNNPFWKAGLIPLSGEIGVKGEVQFKADNLTFSIGAKYSTKGEMAIIGFDSVSLSEGVKGGKVEAGQSVKNAAKYFTDVDRQAEEKYNEMKNKPVEDGASGAPNQYPKDDGGGGAGGGTPG